MARALYQEWLTPDGLTLLQGWRRDGLRLDQIAHNIGITPTTLSHWQAKHEQIKKALAKGREISYYEVENALYKSAMGYDCKEVEQVETYDAAGELISKSKRVRTRHIPPNTGAICFILKNIRPESWQDKPEKYTREDVADDGFLEALSGTSAADWQDEIEESGDLIEE